MADVELEKVYVHDNVTGSDQVIWSPTSSASLAVVPFKDYPCNWEVHIVVKNNTDKLVRVQMKYSDSLVGSLPPNIISVDAYQEVHLGATYTSVPVKVTLTEILYCFGDGCTPTTPISGPPISFDAVGGWVLVTHAFVYGGTDGDKIDAACPIIVSGIGKTASSPDGTMHIFADYTTATVEAKPKYPWEHSYWIIGGTKSTDNPASFTMTDNNYAYAYPCAPIPRFRALEDINGDGKVDLKDFYAVAKAYGSTPDLPNWNPFADINGDGEVDLKDLYKVAMIYGLFDQDLPTTLTVTAPTQAKVQTMTASALNFAVAAAVAMILSAFLKSIVRSLRR